MKREPKTLLEAIRYFSDPDDSSAFQKFEALARKIVRAPKPKQKP